MAEDLRITLRDNVRRLLGLAPGVAGVSKLIALGFSNGNAQRILGAETNIRLGLLVDLAKALHVSPWQLCVPGLDPKSPPQLADQGAAAPVLTSAEARLLALMRSLPSADQRKLVKVAGALQPAGDEPPTAPSLPRPTPELHRDL